MNVMEVVLHVGCAFVFGWKEGSWGLLVKTTYIYAQDFRMELVSTPQGFVAVVEDSIVFSHTFLKEKLKQRY